MRYDFVSKLEQASPRAVYGLQSTAPQGGKMKTMILCLLMLSIPAHASELEAAFASTAVQKEIYKQGLFEESLGQSLSAKASFQRLLASAPKDSRYSDLARRKLCRYDLSFCEASPQPLLESAQMTSAQKNRAAELKRLLKEVDGIEISLAANRIIIDGECTTPRDLERVQSVVALYDSQSVTSLVRLSPSYQRMLAQATANDINNPELTIRTIDEALVIEGMASNEQEKLRAQKIAASYANALANKREVVNLIEVKKSSPREPAAE